ncbi:MAG: branched-chain amino acid ABC transporter permease [Stellaceae bacterium]
MQWLDTIIQGILLGGLYAIFAAGLSLVFGIMRLVNIAHGDLIVLAAYLGLVVMEATGFSIIPALVIVVILMSVVGYALQRGILNATLGDDLLPPLLVTFGISIILQSGLQEIFTADSQKLHAGAVTVASLDLANGLVVGVLPLIQFVAAVVLIGGLQFMLSRTDLGRSFRAVSDDQEVARLMGIDNRHVYGLAMAISLAVVAVAGILLAVQTDFNPTIGPSRLIYGFEAVIIGGLGNLWGTLAGGVIVGVAQAVGAKLDPSWQILAGNLVFLFVLAVRPTGLFHKGVVW